MDTSVWLRCLRLAVALCLSGCSQAQEAISLRNGGAPANGGSSNGAGGNTALGGATSGSGGALASLLPAPASHACVPIQC